MKLRDLIDPEWGGFIRRVTEHNVHVIVSNDPTGLDLSQGTHEEIHDQERFVPATFADADGVWFACPKCFAANGGFVGTHSVCCWRPQVPQTVKPIPGRWEFQGSSLDDLTLVAGSSSILLTSGCMAHFWIRNGSIEGLT